MNSGSLADWFVAGGTILLGFIAIFQDRIRAHLRSPKLDCEIELKPPDCHRTKTNIHTQDVSYSIDTFYYRFKVCNKGETSAEKVEVIITDIFRKEGNSYKRIDSFSLDNLVWSILGEKGERKIYCDYISHSTFKYCNLGHIHDPKHRNNILGEDNLKLPVNKNEAIFCFDVYFRSNILYYLVEPGTYKIKIKVGCANAKTITKEYELIITGKWFKDESRMLSDGLSIKELTQ